jgi:hypothetical protein
MVIALGMATVAGGVHGTLAWAAGDNTLPKIALGCAAAIVMVMAGAISARRTVYFAIALGIGMGLMFFVARWLAWSLMEGGVPLATGFLGAGPLGWPSFLDSNGISGFWILEFTSVMVPAVFGTIVGQERTA